MAERTQEQPEPAQEEPERAEEQQGSGIRRAVSEMRSDLSREKMDERLNEVIEERPLVRHLLDMQIVLRAVLIAGVAALIVLIILSARLAGLVLILAFFAAWVFLATRSYERRRGTRDASEADEDAEASEKS
jgi:hypothetical protein